MFSLLKKLVALALFALFVSFALNYQIQGKAVRVYLEEFYHAPLVQELVRQGKQTVWNYLHKDVKNGPPEEQVSPQDQKELEKVLKESHR